MYAKAFTIKTLVLGLRIFSKAFTIERDCREKNRQFQGKHKIQG